MSLTSIIVTALAKPVTTWILKRYVSDFAGDAGGDLVAELVKSGFERREAKKAVAVAEDVAKGIVETIGRSLAGHDRPHLNPESVAFELAGAFGDSLKTDALVVLDLDENAVLESLRHSHPLKPGHFSAAESSLYERGLQAVATALVESAPKLPDYLRKRDQAMLARLNELRGGITAAVRTLKVVRDETDILADFLVKKPQSKKEQFAADYRTQVVETLDELDLFGVDLPKEARKYKLPEHAGTFPEGSENFPARSGRRYLPRKPGSPVTGQRAGGGRGVRGGRGSSSGTDGRPAGGSGGAGRSKRETRAAAPHRATPGSPSCAGSAA
jgi:hypothetical protein